MYKLFFPVFGYSKYRNIYQYYKHTTCVKNKRWLNSITNFENLYKYCVFHYNDTANSENMRDINTAWKAKVVLLSHPMLIKPVFRVMFECKLNK